MLTGPKHSSMLTRILKREAYSKNYINIHHIPTDEQAADVLTKPLPYVKHVEAFKLFNIRPFVV